jgi:type II secretory ATPase GspE/PulE/Tfp pilus assembly ATPase PilB-like protein
MGHLVLSTVDCNDGMAAINQLLDVDVSNFLIESCLPGAIPQRFARKSCHSWMTLRELSDSEKARFPRPADSIKMVAKGHGYKNYFQRGYRGKIAIFDSLIKKSWAEHPSVADKEVVFDDFSHADSFLENIFRLRKDRTTFFEDVGQLPPHNLQNSGHMNF